MYARQQPVAYDKHSIIVLSLTFSIAFAWMAVVLGVVILGI